MPNRSLVARQWIHIARYEGCKSRPALRDLAAPPDWWPARTDIDLESGRRAVGYVRRSRTAEIAGRQLPLLFQLSLQVYSDGRLVFPRRGLSSSRLPVAACRTIPQTGQARATYRRCGCTFAA